MTVASGEWNWVLGCAEDPLFIVQHVTFIKNLKKNHFYLRCESTELPTSCGNNFQMACTAPWRGLETRGRTRRGFLEGIFHAAGEAEAFPVLTAKKRPKRVSGRQRNQGLCVKALQSLEGTLHLLGAEAGCKRKIFCLWCLWGQTACKRC